MLGLDAEIAKQGYIDKLYYYISKINPSYQLPAVFPSLRELDLSSNAIRGSLPYQISSMMFLKKLGMNFQFII